MKLEIPKSHEVISAIRTIRPHANFIVAETYSSLIWHNGGDIAGENQEKPTEKEFDDALTAWKAEYDAQAYARARKDEYPSYAEQFDILYHKGVAGLKAELKKTKDKYPKLKTQQ